jgi:Na+-driven multidrug efflux pump
MTPHKFLKIYWPLLVSFIGGRLIMQTDLLMIATLGESATAAFALPLRIMVLDMVVAFAFAPVISVAVGAAKTVEEKGLIVRRALLLCVPMSLILTIAGLFLYLRLIPIFTNDAAVAGMASDAVIWLTFAIPARLTMFVASMAIHGLGRGKSLLALNVAEVILNFLLNAVLMFGLGFGFKGAYIGTFIISYAGLLWSLALLRPWIFGKGPRAVLELGWIKELLSPAAAEVGRIASERLTALAVLAIFSAAASTSLLSAFAVAMEAQFLLLMPLVAVMRAAAMSLAGGEARAGDPYAGLGPVLRPGLAVSAIAAVLLFGAGIFFGPRAYHLSAEAARWWHPFLVYLAIWLPLKFADSLQRGVWQSRRRFDVVSLVDASCQWLVLVPAVFIGVRLNSPWLTWGGFLAFDVCSAATLYGLRGRLKVGSND